MTIEKILERLDKAGFITQRLKFRVGKAPEPPYVIYFTNEDVRGSDDKNRLSEVELHLELYTDRSPNPELEDKIETIVLYDIEYQKYQADIEDEDMVQTAYELTFIQKMKGE